MNLSLLDPFQNDLPEVIEEYLEHGITKCIAFNRRGTLLAAGCADGSCIVWDFVTRGIAAEYRDNNCSSPITSVSWSKCGHHLLAASTDKTLSIWDVGKGEKIASVTLDQVALHARFHPGLRRPFLCLACPLNTAPFLVDVSTGVKHLLPVSASPAKTPEAQPARGKTEGNGFSFSAASFNKKGDLIYLGNSKGEILIIETETREILRTVQVPNGSPIRQIIFSRNGSHVLTNSTDRVLRAFDNLLPRENSAAFLRESPETKPEVLRLSKEFQDAINKTHWKTATFSHNDDAEYVVGACTNKDVHKIHVWNRDLGQSVRTLECPKEGVVDMAWHPTRPLLASVSLAGLIFIWAKDYTENWSAFAPDFRELEENEEYVEREDEFDINAEPEKPKAVYVENDDAIDITTAEKILAFSDTDDESQDNLYFLPTNPLPDSPEPEEPSQPPSSPAKVQAESNSSPVSEDQNPAEVTTTAVQQSTSPPEEEAGGSGRAKRKRKLSEKAAELQAEIGRKTKGKTLRTKSARALNSGEATEATKCDSEETQDDLREEPPPKKLTKRQKLKQVSNLNGADS